jgi:hypothetical protein
MWRQLFAAVLGVAAVAGTAAAQSPPPQPLPPIVAVAAPVAAPAGTGFAIPQVMPASGGTNGPATLAGDGVRGVITQAPISYGMSGQGCANGCGNYKHDLGFMFGSCKSFFDPCGPQPCDGFGGGRFRGGHGGLCGGNRCPAPPFGTPYGIPHSHCRYDSWLNY